MHFCAAAGRLDLAEILHAVGGDLLTEDGKGRVAADIALEAGHEAFAMWAQTQMVYDRGEWAAAHRGESWQKFEKRASMFDFKGVPVAPHPAHAGGSATLTAGKDNTVAFTFPGGAIQSDNGAGPWMGICTNGTTALVGNDWYQCNTSRAGGFVWAADFIPPPGKYTVIMVPKGGNHDAPIGMLALTVFDAGSRPFVPFAPTSSGGGGESKEEGPGAETKGADGAVAFVPEARADVLRARSKEQTEAEWARGVETISHGLGVSPGWAQVMLEEYAFNPEAVTLAWIENPQGVCERCGLPWDRLQAAAADGRITLPEAADGGLRLEKSESGGRRVRDWRLTGVTVAGECMICCDDFPDLRGLGCGHNFCQDDWGGYLDNAILGEAKTSLTCMYQGCPFRVPREFLRDCCSDRAAAVYERMVLRSFVDKEEAIKWCPADHCEDVVQRMRRKNYDHDAAPWACHECGESNGGGTTECHLCVEARAAPREPLINFNQVNCQSGPHFFCFECGDLPHDPCSCALWQTWLDVIKERTGYDPLSGESDADILNKLSDEWLKKNTKPCPQCQVAVLKADGCNHMTCRNPKCGHQWCWICMQDWSKCGGYWDCKQYKGEGPTSNSEENTRINARLLESKDANEIFSNFVAQEASRKTEAELLDVQSLQGRMDALRRAMPPDAREGVDTQFLYDAILQVSLLVK